MVATGGVLRPGAAAKLACKHHQRALQHAPLLQILNQAGDRLIHGPAQWFMGLHVSVGVPASVAAAGMADLDEADAVLHQTSRH